MKQYVKVSELPASLQSALKSVKYGGKDVSVESAETWDAGYAGGQGQKGFCIAVNLHNGEKQITWGSWGGANMFNPTNAVDLDRTPKPMVEGLAIIHGAIGYPRTYAWISIHPDNAQKLLPETTDNGLSRFERAALSLISGIKSSYRAQEWTRGGYKQPALPGKYSPDNPLILSLVEKGLLKMNKARAISVTTAGRNALLNTRSLQCA